MNFALDHGLPKLGRFRDPRTRGRSSCTPPELYAHAECVWKYCRHSCQRCAAAVPPIVP